MRLVWYFFFSPLLSGRVKGPFQPLFLCFNSKPYGMRVKSISSQISSRYEYQFLGDGLLSLPIAVIVAKPLSLLCPYRRFSALRLQHHGQSGRTGARSGDFGARPITDPHAVKPVAVMGDLFDCMQVDHSMPSDLDKRIAP